MPTKTVVTCDICGQGFSLSGCVPKWLMISRWRADGGSYSRRKIDEKTEVVDSLTDQYNNMTYPLCQKCMIAFQNDFMTSGKKIKKTQSPRAARWQEQKLRG